MVVADELLAVSEEDPQQLREPTVVAARPVGGLPVVQPARQRDLARSAERVGEEGAQAIRHPLPVARRSSWFAAP